MLRYSIVIVILIAVMGFLWQKHSSNEVSMKFNSDEVGYYKLLESGNIDLRASNFVEARTKYDQAIKLKPALFTAYNNRGCLKIMTAQNSEAIQDFNTAVKINPDYDCAFFNRGIAKLNLGDRAGALDDFNKAVSLEPDPCSYTKRAQLKKLLNDFDGARQDLDKAKAKEKEEEHDHSEIDHVPALHYTIGLSLQAN